MVEVGAQMEEFEGVNCCDYHRWGYGRRRGVTSGAVTEECCSKEQRHTSTFTAQVYWTLRWINTVLMKQKHVKITPCSI